MWCPNCIFCIEEAFFDEEEVAMAKSVRVAGLVIVVAALAALAIWQWLPALFFFPAGTALLLWNGNAFSVGPHSHRVGSSKTY